MLFVAHAGTPEWSRDGCTRTRQDSKSGIISSTRFRIASGRTKGKKYQDERYPQGCFLVEENLLLLEFTY